MGKNARHNFRSQDMLDIIGLMAKKGWTDNKIATTLGLEPLYFSWIISTISELSEALTRARDEPDTIQHSHAHANASGIPELSEA